MTHRNAHAAAYSTQLAALAVWLSDKEFHYSLSTVVAIEIAGAVVTAVLFVGKRGVKGTLLAFWRGGLVAWIGTDPPKKP